MVVAALLLAVQVVRTAVVAQYAELLPGRAAMLWPDHPRVELTLGLTQIATASRQRKPVPPSTIGRIMDSAVKMPLAPDPFLVRGVQAHLERNEPLAGQAFGAAKQRDGRSIPARYFLAEHYFRVGDAADGLREMASLGRMVPNGVASLAPYVATYAKDRRNWPALKSLFRSDPGLENAALTALSADVANADLVLALGDIDHAPAGNWPTYLITALVNAQQYGRARDIWARSARVRPPADGIFDPAFANPGPPPPFNWALTSSTVGDAERRPGGGLHVIFYGQEDGALASQLLLLEPGTYWLSMPVSGDTAHSRSLVWTLSCANSNAALARVPLSPAVAARGISFTVPPNCPAQKLELDGVSADMPQQVDVTIGQLRLERQRG